MIKFHCPHCGNKLGVKDEYADRHIRCIRCKQAVRVPMAPVNAEDAVNPLAAALEAEEAARSKAQPAELAAAARPVPPHLPPSGDYDRFHDVPASARFGDPTRGRYSNTGSVTDAKLLKVAWCQKTVIYCFVAYILLFAGMWFAPPTWWRGLLLLDPVITLVAIASVSLLAWMTAGGWEGIIYGVLTLIVMWIPLVNLIVLLVVNRKASELLSNHRVPVGFLGVPTAWMIETRREAKGRT